MKKDTPLIELNSGTDWIQRLLEIHFTDSDSMVQVIRLNDFILDEIKRLSSQSGVFINSLFTGLCFLRLHTAIPYKYIHAIHDFRIRLKKLDTEDHKQIFQIGMYGILGILGHHGASHIPVELISFLQRDDKIEFSPTNPIEQPSFSHWKVMLLHFDVDKSYLEFISETEPGKKYVLDTSFSDFQMFLPGLMHLGNQIPLPCSACLHEVKMIGENKVTAQAISLIPDYLIDVTAIADANHHQDDKLNWRLIQKWIPDTSSTPILIGNIANDIFDALISHPHCPLSDLYPKFLHKYALQFAIMQDQELNEVIQKITVHYNNIKRVIQETLPTLKILREECYVELSFLNPEFGIQGRLDLYHQPENEFGLRHIIELKSGKVFRPNSYGLNANHYLQTLLYEMLVRQQQNPAKRIQSFILYSIMQEHSLRSAPIVKPLQWEALATRNELIAAECIATQWNDLQFKAYWIENLCTDQYVLTLNGFQKQKSIHLHTIIQQAQPIELAYCRWYASFIAREHTLAKIGSFNAQQIQGQAVIWNASIQEKQSSYLILSHLCIQEISIDAQDPIIILQRTENTEKIASFRKGDIIILYPCETGALNSLIHKATILELNNQWIKIRLRSAHFHQKAFLGNTLWNIESDLLDSSFSHMYKSFAQFLEASHHSRNVLLGLIPPTELPKKQLTPVQVNGMTQEQKVLVERMLSSSDYFLLWGPPGTGKTSIVMKELVRNILVNSNDQILILAYTNRAVDEICQSLDQIPTDLPIYTRIGSRYSTGEEYVNHLFDQKIASCKTRADISTFIESTRIFTSTIAGIQSKHELFQIKQFDWIIIDEASQILEPYIIHLLTKAKKRILIGDHRQLPAVVVQPIAHCEISDPLLKEAGFKSTHISLFERLYEQCLKNQWHWAFGMLSAQGRMHEEILQIPNALFYNQKLACLSKLQPGTDRLYQQIYFSEKYAQWNSRFAFFHMEDHQYDSNKTNETEAKAVALAIADFYQIYQDHGWEWNGDTCGVITPFKAQIALIRKFCYTCIPDYVPIMIDTVERYQGGAKDLIFISLCVKQKQEASMISTLDHHGKDRKLNVAITRAKERCYLFGNAHILTHHPDYKKLLDITGISEFKTRQSVN